MLLVSLGKENGFWKILGFLSPQIPPLNPKP